MPERPVLEDGLTPPSTLVAAAPTDAFVQTNAGAQAEQLARSLSQLSPEISKLYQVQQTQQNEKDTEEGAIAARAALEGNITNLHDAIKAGKIDPASSPVFRAAAQAQFGRVAAGSFAAYARVQAAGDPGLSVSTDTADFTKWYNQTRKDWEQANLGEDATDRFFQEAYGKANDVYYEDGLNQFSKIAADRLVKQTGEGHFQEVMDAYTTINASGDTAENKAAARVEAANQLIRIQRMANPKGSRQMLEMTAKAIASYAMQTDDVLILDDLTKIQAGSGSLSTTMYGSAIMEDTKNTIADDLAKKFSRANQVASTERTMAVRGVLAEAADRLSKSKDPHNEDLRDLTVQLHKLGYGDEAKTVSALQEAFTHQEYTDDPQIASGLFRRIFVQKDGERATTPEEVANALSAGHLSIQTFRQLNDDMEKENASGGSGAARIMRDPLLKDYQKKMRDLFVATFGFDTPIMRYRADPADSDLTTEYIKYRQGEGKDATTQQAMAWLEAKHNELFTRYSDHSAISDRSKVPASPYATGQAQPSHVDPTKAIVTDPSNISALKREMDEMMTHKRNGLSPASKSVLQSLGINLQSPTLLKDIQSLIKSQQALTYTAPDSTSH